MRLRYPGLEVRFCYFESQHGFRTGRGTDSAISQLANFVERFLLKDEACLAVFLDIRAAFDSIKPEHIKEMLIRY